MRWDLRLLPRLRSADDLDHAVVGRREGCERLVSGERQERDGRTGGTRRDPDARDGVEGLDEDRDDALVAVSKPPAQIAEGQPEPPTNVGREERVVDALGVEAPHRRGGLPVPHPDREPPVVSPVEEPLDDLPEWTVGRESREVVLDGPARPVDVHDLPHRGGGVDIEQVTLKIEDDDRIGQRSI